MSARRYSPRPQARPTEPAIQSKAPVVSPRTSPLAWMIAPAARKAAPEVIALIMRIGAART